MSLTSLKTKLIIYSILLLVISSVSLALGAIFLDWSETQEQNDQRLTAAVASMQRVTQQDISADMEFLNRFLFRLDSLNGYNRVKLLDFSTEAQIDLTEALGRQLDADYFAYYYPVKNKEAEQLRHLFVKSEDGTYLLVERDGATSNRFLQKKADGSYDFPVKESRPKLLGLDYKPQARDISFEIIEGKLMLRCQIPYVVKQAVASLSIAADTALGHFILLKELGRDLTTLDVDYGATFTLYDANGVKGAGRVALPNLDQSTLATADGRMIEMKDASGQEYDTVLLPLQYDKQTIGYVSASISRAVVAGKVAKTITIMSAITAGVCLVILILSLFFVRRFMGPVLQTVGFAEAVASGDLKRELAYRSKDEMGTLAEALRKMVATLKDMISRAEDKTREAEEKSARATEAQREAEQARAEAEKAKRQGMMEAAGQLQGIVERLTSASEELSAQVEQSSSGTSLQSQRLGETATSMTEMNATVLSVAKSASLAAESSDRAKDSANGGAKVVSQVLSAISQVQANSMSLKDQMADLGRKAEGIGTVLNVISDIADQTNLLALNAAIEAARAGDAGRGFAVVADEVRKLAEKTMTATREVDVAIKGIQQGTRASIQGVDSAVSTITEATKLASTAGTALDEIVNMVDAASDQTRSIATASEQQSAASEEINRAIEEINRISSETKTAMEQSAQAIGELAVQAQELASIVDGMRKG